MTPEPSPDSVVIETTLSCTAEAIWASEERSTTRVTDELPPVCTVGDEPLSSKASAVAAPTPPAPSAISTAAAPATKIRRPRPEPGGRCPPTGCAQAGWPSAVHTG